MTVLDLSETILRDALISVEPPPKIALSAWCAENVILPHGTSAQPGRFEPWKYQAGMLNAMGDPLIERVTVMKSVRGGYTRAMVGALAGFAANNPCSVILLVPTEDDARRYSVDEITPTFDGSPTLRGLMPKGRFDGRNTLTQMQIVGGGSLKLLAAKAPRNLRAHDAKVLLIDEVDGMEVTKEGDPVKLAERRTIGHADRKIIMGSTPTLEGFSIIEQNYNRSDMRVFEVPCPSCGERFEMLWEHIKWPEGEPINAHAVCPHGCVIEEKHKPAMVADGEWRATVPEVLGHAGFRFNGLISLFANMSWGRLAKEFIDAKRSGPAELQVFVNTVLAQTWRDTVDAVDESVLQARSEEWGIKFDPEKGEWRAKIPAECLYIICGVDVQIDRLECTLWGWGRNGRFALGHYVIWGATNVKSTWDECDALIKTKWKHSLGGMIGIEATAVDSGDGNRTQQVLDFCTPRFGSRVFAIKGVPGPKPFIEASQNKKSGLRHWNVGVDQVKSDLMQSLLAVEGAPNYIRFSKWLDSEWYRQLTSERRKVKYVHGRPVYEWTRIENRAAEVLDASVYATAVRRLIRFDFDARETALKSTPNIRRSLGDMAKALNG